MSDSDDLTAVWADLQRRWPEHRIEPSLDRIRALTDLLGAPQRNYPVIHVTGTNGKTSTARMIEALLREFGLHTGLLTSPHLVDPRERILFDGQPIDAERALGAWHEIEPYVAVVDAQSVADGGPELSFFETASTPWLRRTQASGVCLAFCSERPCGSLSRPSCRSVSRQSVSGMHAPDRALSLRSRRTNCRPMSSWRMS